MEFKYENDTYVMYEGDRYLIIDRKIENGKPMYRLMGLVFDFIQEDELSK